MAPLDIQKKEESVILGVKVIPGGSRTALAGEYDGMVRIKLSAAPEKGKANQCLIEYIGKLLGIKKSRISIISGATKPVKKIQILDISVKEVRDGLCCHSESTSN
jgi:uncharacterized protein (TIGR00251 family)